MKKQTLLLLRCAILLLLCCAAGYALYQHVGGGRNEQAGAALHQQALHFKLSTLEGGDIELKTLRGKVVLVNFWGTFCTPCKEEMPVMQKAYNRFKGDGFEIIAVNVRESKGAVKSFVDRHGLTFPVALDQSAEVYRSWEFIICLQVYSLIGKDRPSGCMSEECLSGKLICGLKTFLAVHRNSFKRDRQTPIVLIVHKVALGEERSYVFSY
ncbi:MULTISPECIES: redoxin domain-containing protein [Bacillus]|uniref:redoxin domain-containing protein n=1 Tax=Bacillus TaxID=1386 RepID=UPI002244501F|nr:MULTISPECIES: redoxin domain-containing protein [Bacillus]MDN5390063.1 redoxin domain-containing protein [Bacillus sp. LB7]MEC1021471.1 redoxin domain-containing protein [Bacillus paralicheniformis]MEC1024537.1 redoxin domain-containing protein [Bacillus paralicheniformis]MEC1034656.1 redoxin domain-containing protein [Bacillus paralicheniformis]MEC1049301.1 redoxin domain-containing protein [Bacillus paralicheniformis]